MRNTVKRRLARDLGRWERGEARLDDLCGGRDAAAVVDLVETHTWLTVAASEQDHAPGMAWHALALYLQERTQCAPEPPVFEAVRAAPRLRRTYQLVAVAAVAALLPAAATSARSHGVDVAAIPQHVVTAVAGAIGSVFPIGDPDPDGTGADAHSPAAPRSVRAPDPGPVSGAATVEVPIGLPPAVSVTPAPETAYDRKPVADSGSDGETTDES